MKFSCEKLFLQSAINTASRVTATKSSIPALEGILLQAGAQLTISGYNMQTGIRTTLDAAITEEGALVLPSRLFGEIIRKMPDDVVTFSSDKNLNVRLTCGDADYNIQALSADDYPDMPEVEDQYSIRIQQKILRSMIAETGFAVSTDEVRPIHTGSLFEISEEGLTVVSVDGFRLALRREPLEAVNGGSFSFVAPGAALNEVEKICDDTGEEAVITLGQRHLLFEMGSNQLICRRLEGEFLDYKAAIPRSNPIVITADTKNMIQSIDRVSVVISEKQKSPVQCLFTDGKVTMSARTAAGEAKDVCPITGDGKELRIGFNNRYLMDALKNAPADAVRIEMNTGISPCVILPAEGEERFLYMVLPVRLKNNG
ncbi:MAG: DNA polymerase III subunit beta [Oscillospiraceae bacterium]|nr:DNA polymerase III subunit beta [Oscillospiraceae bacterium]